MTRNYIWNITFIALGLRLSILYVGLGSLLLLGFTSDIICCAGVVCIMFDDVKTEGHHIVSEKFIFSWENLIA